MDVLPNAIKKGVGKLVYMAARSKRKIEEKWRSNLLIAVVGNFRYFRYISDLFLTLGYDLIRLLSTPNPI